MAYFSHSYQPQPYQAHAQAYQGMPTPSPSAAHSRAATPGTTAAAAPTGTGTPGERQGPGRPRRDRAAERERTATAGSGSGSGAGATPDGQRERQQVFKGAFTKDLMHLMYAFGDVPNPAPDSVSVLEEMVIEYIIDLCQSPHRLTPSKTRMQVDDLRQSLRHDADGKELGRLEELLFLHEEIKRARAEFEVDNGV